MNRIVWDGELVSSKDLHIYDLAAAQDVMTWHNGSPKIAHFISLSGVMPNICLLCFCECPLKEY